MCMSVFAQWFINIVLKGHIYHKESLIDQVCVCQDTYFRVYVVYLCCNVNFDV